VKRPTALTHPSLPSPIWISYMGEGGERELGPIPPLNAPQGTWSPLPISALEMGGLERGLGGRRGMEILF